MKTISKLSLFARTLLIMLLFAFVLATFSARLSIISGLGWSFYHVVSGSMAPNLPAGALMLIHHLNTASLKVGDVITFQAPENKVAVTHRIVNILNGQFQTKGDANQIVDSQLISAQDILGKYIVHIPYLGYVASFMQQPQGFWGLIIAPAMFLLFWEVVSLVTFLRQNMTEKKQKGTIGQRVNRLASVKRFTFRYLANTQN